MRNIDNMSTQEIFNVYRDRLDQDRKKKELDLERAAAKHDIYAVANIDETISIFETDELICRKQELLDKLMNLHKDNRLKPAILFKKGSMFVKRYGHWESEDNFWSFSKGWGEKHLKVIK